MYFGLRSVLATAEIGWVCVLCAFPFALGGFFQYNGMTLEQFLLAYIRTEFIYPHRLVFKSDNLYAKLMERSSMKEALKIDYPFGVILPQPASLVTAGWEACGTTWER